MDLFLTHVNYYVGEIIHPLTEYLILTRVVGMPEPIPAVFRQCGVHPELVVSLSIKLPCMFFECGTKPEYPEKTEAGHHANHTGRL